MQFYPLTATRITGGPFASALDRDREYVLSLDPDRLLAPFMVAAGLEARAPAYGSWESSGLDGHTAGHVLSALSLLVAARDDEVSRDRLDYLVGELRRAQQALGTGYLGGVPGGSAVFERLRSGGTAAARALGSAKHWVPWYNLHKTFQGLIDAHAQARHPDALSIVVRLADWWMPIAAELDDDVFEAMLDTEYGGMNEAFAHLARLTGRTEFAAMALRFSHRQVLDPLLSRRDELTGLHANTQIQKALGYAVTASVTGEKHLHEAAGFFWGRVTGARSVSIGGDSVREHFHPDSDFRSMLEDREGPESCNTYHLLKLTRVLAEAQLRPEHLDFAERALFNNVLASQHPTRGGFVYFTPLRPRHYRVYSSAEECFWCCVGTGMEAQTRYAEWVFGVEDGALAINLFVPARLHAAGFDTTVTIDTHFPFEETVSVRVDPVEPREFTVRLRVPSWSAGLEDLRVNGESPDAERSEGAVLLRRVWSPGDSVTFRLPLQLRAEPLPDGSPWRSYAVGPLVLAAREGAEDLDGLTATGTRMGHVAAGALHPVADLPIVSAAPAAEVLTPVGELRFRLDPLNGDPVVLEPFSGIHDERYTVYWPVASDDSDLVLRRTELEALDAGADLDAATVDVVALGEQQPETEHGFVGPDARLVTGGGRVTATRLTVTLCDEVGDARIARITAQGADQNGAVEVFADGDRIGEGALPAGTGTAVWQFVLPPAMTPRDISVELVASGSSTPVIREVRIVR